MSCRMALTLTQPAGTPTQLTHSPTFNQQLWRLPGKQIKTTEEAERRKMGMLLSSERLNEVSHNLRFVSLNDKVLTILHLLVQQSFDFIFVHITNHMDENITCCLRVDFIHGRKCFTKSSKISIYERKHQMLSDSLHPLVILVPTPAPGSDSYSAQITILAAWHTMGGGQNIRELSTLLWTLKLIQTQLSKFARMWSWLGAHTFRWLLFVKPTQFKVLAHQNYPRWREHSFRVFSCDDRS